ncbi:hypothetical protein GZH46_01940, partial [Fragariocoptes setiger]
LKEPRGTLGDGNIGNATFRSHSQQSTQDGVIIESTTMKLFIKNRSLASSMALLMMILAVLSSANASDDKIKDLIKSQGTIELKVIEAKVPDLDPLPGQQESDVFVRVFLNDTRELICETQTVQNENEPQFNKDCRWSKPVSTDTILRFEIFDSDKPAPEPDFVGISRVKISDLILNRKLDQKEQLPIEGQKFPKYFLRVKIDFVPEKKN